MSQQMFPEILKFFIYAIGSEQMSFRLHYFFSKALHLFTTSTKRLYTSS